MSPRLHVLLAVMLVACGKKVPPEFRTTLELVRPDARRVADAAAKECAAQFASGRFTVTPKSCSVNKLPGETVVPITDSPAKGTPLETNPLVLDVTTVCNAPRSGDEWCGNGLGALHNAIKGPGANRTRKVIDGDCRSSSTDCEDVISPSQSAADENSVDLRIVKPVVGGPPGATVEVTVILAKKSF